MICGIYKITNKINGKIYIGQSMDIQARWSKHKSYYKNSDQQRYKIYRAMNKYGLENFSFQIIEQCDKSLLNEREQYWIKIYDSFKNGYNMTPGGAGILKVNDKAVLQYTPEGVFVKQYQSAHAAQRETGIQFTNICKVCRKERDHAGGFIWKYKTDSSEVKPIVLKSIKRNTAVLQYDLKNNFIAEYKSAKQAYRKTGINDTLIGKVCKGLAKTAGGYLWKYKKE